MEIPDANLDEFIDLWEQAYGERPDRDRARRRATELLELFKLVGPRLPSEAQPIVEAPPTP